MNIILFGFKGCGKTHFAKRLAKTTARSSIDTDDLIVQNQHCTIQEIYKRIGEIEFRSLEKKILFSLKPVQNAVIAVGGGAVCDPENVAFLQKLGTLVYLKAPSQLLESRIFQKELPAIFDPRDPLECFHKMFQERLPLYESISAYQIDLQAFDEAGVLAQLRSILLSNGI